MVRALSKRTRSSIKLGCLISLPAVLLVLTYTTNSYIVIHPNTGSTVAHKPLTSEQYRAVYKKITRSSKSYMRTNYTLWNWIPETSGPGLGELVASPSLLGNGEEVTLTWSGIKEQDKDWIGLYCPANSRQARVIDFWWVHELNPGQAKFELYNVRTDCQFRYFSFTRQSGLVTRSNLIHFRGSDRAHLHVHLALTKAADEMRVQWTTGQQCIPTVHYGLSPHNLQYKATGVSRTYTASDMCAPPANMSDYFIDPGYLHDVLLTDLVHDTVYYYQLSGTGISSNVRSFRTSIHTGSDLSFSFDIYGDMDIAPSSELTASHVHTDIENGARFVLHIGDLSYATGLAYRWDEWMTLIEPLSSKVPYMVSIGNHEQCYIGNAKKDPSGNSFYPPFCRSHDSGGECGVPVMKRFHMPDNGNSVWWYSFKYGLAHIIQLSTAHYLSPGSVQYNWLERELKTVDHLETPWLIVTGHRPMYTSQKDSQDFKIGLELRSELEDLFHKHSVDFYIAGHLHLYERTCKVYKEKCQADGTVHITVGTGGTTLDDDHKSMFDWLEKFQSSHGYGRITVSNRTALLWEFFNVYQGDVSDSIWVFK